MAHLDETLSRLAGLHGDDSLIGTNGPDTLNGKDGDDTVRGSEGNDVLIGGNGSDRLDGGDGDDILRGGRGDNTLVGGGGLDVADFAKATTGLRIELTDGFVVNGGASTDLLEGISGVAAGPHADTIFGGLADNLILGRDGDDYLSGEGGSDTLIGGGGDDEIGESDVLPRIPGADLLAYGGGGDDFLFSDYYAATMFGGRGDDDIYAILGLVFGGAGNDQIENFGSAAIAGGRGDDVVIADTDQGSVRGGAGDDQIQGFGLVQGGAGDDILDPYSDGFLTDLHATLAGGRGWDELVDVTNVDLRDHQSQDIGYGTAVVSGMEYVRTDGGTVIGDRGANLLVDAFRSATLMGRGGDDVLSSGDGRASNWGSAMFGGGGDDRLQGTAQGDTMFGGAGSDVFAMRNAELSRDVSLASMIMDLSNADVIDLSPYAHFHFVLVDHLDGHAGELALVYDKAAHVTWLEGETHNRLAPDLFIGLEGKHTDFTNFVL